MNQRYGVTAALLVITAISFGSWTSAAGNDTNRNSLITMWESQIQVNSSRDQVADVLLHVHDDRANSYFEIRYSIDSGISGEGTELPDRVVREIVALDDLNPRGIPFSDLHDDKTQGARDWAELRKVVLEEEGRENVEVELMTVPRTTLYAFTGQGNVHAIDAENGRTRWTRFLGGLKRKTAIGLAANNEFVIAVYGARIYCLNVLTGEEVWSQALTYAPGGGVAMSEDFAYVTSISGRLQVFPLNDRGLPVSYFSATGRAIFDPAVTPTTVSWPTDKGFLNVARSDKPSMRYRLRTDDHFSAAGTAVSGKLIANSTNGKVYAVHEDAGVIAWEFAVGERLDQKPIGIGKNAVALITSRNNLVALDTEKGTLLEGWPKRVSGVTEYVGASQNLLYFVEPNGRLAGLNRVSGATASLTSIPPNVSAVPNHITDRLYFAAPSGRIFCMREIANVNPVVHGEDFVVGNAAADAESKRAKSALDDPIQPSGDSKPAETTEPDDPFSSGGDPDDPFSGGGDPDDPFSNDG